MAACQQKRVGFRDAERNICVELHWRMALAVYVETYSHTHTHTNIHSDVDLSYARFHQLDDPHALARTRQQRAANERVRTLEIQLNIYPRIKA
jgi:hypothetical protein